MANVKKSVEFSPVVLERVLSEKKMSLNELASRIAVKNRITKEAEMTSLRRYKRTRQISLSALEDIGQILNIDPSIFRGKEITYVHLLRENETYQAQESDLTYKKYLDRLKAEEQLENSRLINKEALLEFLSNTPFYVDIQKMDEVHREYYLFLLTIEIQRLLTVASTSEVELERTEVRGKTNSVIERFRVISRPEKTLPHPEDYNVSKKG